MRRTTKSVSISEVIQHLLAGAGLGAWLGLVLVFNNTTLSHLVVSHASGPLFAAAFVAVSSAMVGVGSALTGFIFSAVHKA